MLKWIEYNLPFFDDDGAECFYYSKLMRPGIMMELDKGGKLLIGNINIFANGYSDQGEGKIRYVGQKVLRYADVLS